MPLIFNHVPKQTPIIWPIYRPRPKNIRAAIARAIPIFSREATLQFVAGVLTVLIGDRTAEEERLDKSHFVHVHAASPPFNQRGKDVRGIGSTGGSLLKGKTVEIKPISALLYKPPREKSGATIIDVSNFGASTKAEDW